MRTISLSLSLQSLLPSLFYFLERLQGGAAPIPESRECCEVYVGQCTLVLSEISRGFRDLSLQMLVVRKSKNNTHVALCDKKGEAGLTGTHGESRHALVKGAQ